ncbi:acyltransferase family protein [Acinetobacter pittii]|uniref:acyltransferase family protein n=1 Tax=Acinetobacter pittii TaxID=48296 RepID=UPI0013D131AC|nr:acyltransferase family protein [Acinetobacter pittii]
MKFRNDIQILRGIAVSLVVLFHLEIVGFSSGFLGVDVFFVVSGFLMAILYNSEQKKEFFIKRAKRLLPSYFTVVFITLLASVFLVLPSEQTQVVNQSIYSLFFANNIGFWQQESYFSKSNFNPLLHLWSLGVEIQFYLIIPLLVWFFRKSIWFLIFTLLGSLVVCFLITGISPKTSFFMMPLRLWEFLIGYIAALYFTNNGAPIYKNKIISIISLACIILIPLVIRVDGNSLSWYIGHPGFFALVVCLATAAILALGLPSRLQENFIARGLVVLGKYSYSIYLVHFPLIVIYLYQPFSGTILHPEHEIDKIILFILIGISSFLLYNLIETKNRKSGLICLVSISCIILLTPVLKITNSLFYSSQELNIFNGLQDRDVYRCGKIFRIIHPKDIVCKINNNNYSKNIVLLGNSHADSIKKSFEKVASNHSYNTYFFVSNTPMMGQDTPPKIVINELKKLKSSVVVVHYKSGSLDLVKFNDLVSLANENNIKVILIKPVPIYKDSVPKMMYNDNVSYYTLDKYNKDNIVLNNFVNTLEKENSKFTSYNTAPVFCQNKCSVGTKDKVPYYFDDDHLNLTGAKLLEPIFEKMFNDIK